MIRLPDFMIVGAAKAGTTSLYYYLKQHPDLFLSEPKEPCYFTFANSSPDVFKKLNKRIPIITSYKDYTSLFLQASEKQLIGDASTTYLYQYEETISNIINHYQDISNLKIIIILRNPIQRAFSHFLNHVRDGIENRSFSDIIKHYDTTNIDKFDDYLAYGLYYDQVRAYYDTFNFVRVFLYDDLVSSPTHFFNEVLSFIGVNSNQIVYSPVRTNISGIPKIQSVVRFLQKPNKIKDYVKPYIPEMMRVSLKSYLLGKLLYRPELHLNDISLLADFYHNDIMLLQELIGRDLVHWLSPDV